MPEQTTQSKIPIKQDLFSFATIRGIEPISYEQRISSFIEHPNILQSKIVNSGMTKAKKGEFDRSSITKHFNSYTDLNKINSGLFVLSTKFGRQNNFEANELEGIKPLSLEQELMVWEGLFYELILRESIRIKTALIQLLKTNHYINGLATAESLEVVDKSIMIPMQIISLIQYYHQKDCKKEMIGVTEVGVIEYRRVEQEVCCYVPGEVSHIENVLAREYKEKHTRDLVRTELTTETSSEYEIENLSDTSTTQRNELNSEIQQTLNQERSFNFGGSISYTSGAGDNNKVVANANADFSNVNSSTASNALARNFAKEITRKTVEKIVQKTAIKRTSKIIKEFETNTRHGFDNREGDEHVTGIYRWVDQIYTCELINYGNRLVYKFTIPHPSEFYKMALLYKNEQEPNVNQPELEDAPKSLEDFGLQDFKSMEILDDSGNEVKEDIVTSLQLASEYYGVDVVTPEITKNEPLMINVRNLDYENDTENTNPFSFVIDHGYECHRIKGGLTVQYRGNRNNKCVSYVIISNLWMGGENYFAVRGKTLIKHFQIDQTISPTMTSSFDYYIQHRKIAYIIGALLLNLRMTDEALQSWKEEVFDSLNQAYQQKVLEYEQKEQEHQADLDAQQAISQEKEEVIENHPLDNRITEQRELKRYCIEMMMKPFCKKLGRDFMGDRSCGEHKIAQVDQTPEFKEYIQYMSFFERAFDWDIMSYVFHPYYWADCDKWVDLIKTKSNDRIFQAFLQSGIAEVMVPVKCEMDLALAYYMETGDIQSGGDLVADDPEDQNASIAATIQNCNDEKLIKPKWDIRLPSTLTILQQDSALITEKGLPCCMVMDDGCCTRMEEYENTISAPNENDENRFKLLKGNSPQEIE